MFRRLVIASLVLSSLTTIGQVSAPKYVNEFLNMGVGARAYGLGGAVVTQNNGAGSGYWNPAGLCNGTYHQSMQLMHAEYFGGIAQYDFVGYSKRLDNSGGPSAYMSLNLIRLGVDNIPNTTQLYDNNGNIDYSRISYFSSADYALIGTYSAQGLPKWMHQKENSKWHHQYGFNTKIIYRQIGDFARAFGFGLDAGWQANNDKWNLGIAVKDITTTFNIWSFTLDAATQAVFDSTQNTLPKNGLELALPRAIAGISRNFQIGNIQLLPELDVVLTTDGRRNTLISSNTGSIDVKTGVEFSYKKWLSLRAGVQNVEKDNAVPSIGLGVTLKQIQLDYALANIGNQNGMMYTNLFSLNWTQSQPRRSKVK